MSGRSQSLQASLDLGLCIYPGKLQNLPGPVKYEKIRLDKLKCKYIASDLNPCLTNAMVLAVLDIFSLSTAAV